MAHIIVAGAGNIGSHVLPHVARMSGVTAVTIIDRDSYESSNVRLQNIARADVGKSKAQVQARRLRAISSSLDARAIHAPIEDLPLGWLRADVLLCCLDSRRGRMVLNQAASRLGVPWINAGIDQSGLARVQVFRPSDDAACLECAWDQRDYELVEQEYPCGEVRLTAFAEATAVEKPDTTRDTSHGSGGSSALGALAASLQALECERLLSGDGEPGLEGRDVLIDARHHRHYVTRFARNPACRMPDHAGWTIGRHPIDPWSMTVDDLRAIATRAGDSSVQVEIAGQQVALKLTCMRCGERRAVLHVHRGNWRRHPEACGSCGGEMVAAGVDLRDSVSLQELGPRTLNTALANLGVLSGDVVRVTSGEATACVELCGLA